MRKFYGVNSYVPMNKILENGFTLYDLVEKHKKAPSFCFRTLCGANAITKAEIDYLRAKKCRIGLIVRNISEEDISSSYGNETAVKAVAEFNTLNLSYTKRIAIFVEINSEWSVNHNWMITFAQTLIFYGYIPGFIGNTDSSLNCNFDRQCSHFVNATADVGKLGAIFCATAPKVSNEPIEWAPFCPSELEPKDMSFWLCSKTQIGSIIFDDVYANDYKKLDNLL